MKRSKRSDAGRPRVFPNGVKRISICLPTELCEDFKKLGGSGWVREQVIKAKRKNDEKRTKEAEAGAA